MQGEVEQHNVAVALELAQVSGRGVGETATQGNEKVCRGGCCGDQFDFAGACCDGSYALTDDFVVIDNAYAYYAHDPYLPRVLVQPSPVGGGCSSVAVCGAVSRLGVFLTKIFYRQSVVGGLNCGRGDALLLF